MKYKVFYQDYSNFNQRSLDLLNLCLVLRRRIIVFTLLIEIKLLKNLNHTLFLQNITFYVISFEIKR